MLENVWMLSMKACTENTWKFLLLLQICRLVLCFTVVNITSSKSTTRCAPDEVALIRWNGSSSCLRCSHCSEGFEPTIRCGSTIRHSTLIACKSCRRGMYKDSYGSELCKPCTPCGKHEIVLSECRQTADTICGKCGKGFYRDNNANSTCLPCSNCCMDEKDVVIEECSRAGLPFNRRCSFHRSKECSTKCGPRQITIVPVATSPRIKDVKPSRCFDCPICPPGLGLNFHCGSIVSSDDYHRHNITCVPCVPGKTFSPNKNYESCRYCSLCGLGSEVIQECSLYDDRVCGNCKPGFYLDSVSSECLECSWCCNDSTDVIVEQCSKQGLPSERRCERNFRSTYECYKLNFKSRHKLNSTNEKNEDNSREDSFAIIGVFVLASLVIILIICFLLFNIRMKKYKKSSFYRQFLEKATVKTDKPLYEIAEPSLKGKTKTKDCESRKLEWPTCAGPLVPYNAIRFEKSGVEILFYNRESYRKNHNQIAVEIVWNSKAHLNLSSNSFALSPVIKFHHKGVKLTHPVLLTLPHSARLDTTKNDWFMVVKSAKLELGKIPEWKEVIKQSHVEKSIDEQVENLIIEHCQLKLEVNELIGFVVIGQPRDPGKTVYKRMQCAVFTKEQVLTGSDIVLSLYLIDDCEASFEKIVQIEKKKGRKMTGSHHSFNFRCTSEGQIYIDSREITPEWEIVQGPKKSPQEIPFTDCLNSYHTIPHREIKFVHKDHKKKTFHCTLELSDSYGKALAVMPISVYCYEDPSNQTVCGYNSMPKVANTTTVNMEITKEPYPDLPRRALTLQEKLNLKLFDLPLELREKIAFRLDNSNWKDLASRVGVTSDEIRYFEMCYMDPKGSPANQLFCYIDAKMPGMKLSGLLRILKEIKSQDICEMLNNWLHESDSTDV